MIGEPHLLNSLGPLKVAFIAIAKLFIRRVRPIALEEIQLQPNRLLCESFMEVIEEAKGTEHKRGARDGLEVHELIDMFGLKVLLTLLEADFRYFRVFWRIMYKLHGKIRHEGLGISEQELVIK